MNMAGAFATDFAAELANARPVAQHCAELIARGPRPEEREEHIAAWSRDLALELAQELGPLFSAGKLHVTVAEPEITTGHAVFERIGPVAVNCLLRCGDDDQTVLLSLDYATAVALTDCSFGGDGNLPDQVPSQLPRSAGLLVEQVAMMIATAIALSRGPATGGRGDVLVRSDSAVRLKPFAATDAVACFALTLAQGAFAEWNALIAVASERLDDLLPSVASPRARAGSAGQHASAGAASPDVFAGLPLGLEAVLGEFELTLERLGRLAPGDEIPLAVPRELPLRTGETVLALGTLGTFDNRMALRVTRLPVNSDRPDPAAAFEAPASDQPNPHQEAMA